MGIPLNDTSRLQDLQRLRSQISRMQRSRAETSLLPADPALSSLFPDAGLRVGVAYSVAPSPSLLAALLSPPSQKGHWCALIGMPTIGLEALAGFGVDLSRLVLVPDPGERWLTITSALSEVVPLVAVRPQVRPKESDAARLNARLRDRSCTLLVAGTWPQSEATLCVEDPEWHGLGQGSGLLTERAVTITATSRRRSSTPRVRVLLPGPDGVLAPVPHTRAPIPLRRGDGPARPAVPGFRGRVAG